MCVCVCAHCRDITQENYLPVSAVLGDAIGAEAIVADQLTVRTSVSILIENAIVSVCVCAQERERLPVVHVV